LEVKKIIQTLANGQEESYQGNEGHRDGAYK
jgi:hypothetical protein